MYALNNVTQKTVFGVLKEISLHAINVNLDTSYKTPQKYVWSAQKDVTIA